MDAAPWRPAARRSESDQLSTSPACPSAGGWVVEVVHVRCCGLDIHKKLIVACAVTPASNGQPSRQVRTFGTMTDELQHQAGWLSGLGVTHVAMESTGSYWKPIFNVLEE